VKRTISCALQVLYRPILVQQYCQCESHDGHGIFPGLLPLYYWYLSGCCIC
jgi:hypothetical protein